MLHMNETCDRCGPAVPAAYRVTRDGELYLCRHCTSQLWPALSPQGCASTAALRAAAWVPEPARCQLAKRSASANRARWVCHDAW